MTTSVVRIWIVAALAIVVFGAAAGSAISAPPKPLDTFQAQWSISLSDTTLGSHPNLTDQAVTGFAINTSETGQDLWKSFFTGLTPSPGWIGDRVGSLSLAIQSGVVPGLPGNITASGQPPTCGSAGTVSITPPVVDLYAATTSLSGPLVSSAYDDANPPWFYDQETDPAHNVPLGVNYTPDILPPLMDYYGIQQSEMVARAYGVLQMGGFVNYSINVITASVGGGWYQTIVFIGAFYNPHPALLTTWFCPPTTLSLQRFGVGQGNPGYLPAPVPMGNTMLTVNALSTSLNFDLAASSADDYDSDNVAKPYDNCRADANPMQQDSLQNGIGDACRNGGSWVNVAPAAVANAWISCSDPGHSARLTPPWDVCQDADQDGVINQEDNCPLTWQPWQAQIDSDGDTVGDVCDPQPNIKSDGAGYLNGALPGIVTSGQYHDHDTYCVTLLAVNVGPVTIPCVIGSGPADSNDDGVPDFGQYSIFFPGCTQDHTADSNGDGYSDADQGTPFGTALVAGCMAGTVFPTPNTVRAAVVGNDPLRACSGRPTGSLGWKRARADVNLDGRVNLLDLGSAASVFGQYYWAGSELDMDGNGKINLLDLGAMAGQFGTIVTAC